MSGSDKERDSAGDAAPDSVWLRPERSGRSRNPALSRDQIVNAAIALADRSGPDAVTMRAVAAELGAGAMSLYWHVPSKKDLIDLMSDQVMAGIVQDMMTGDWRQDLTTLAHRARDTFRQHPWIIDSLISRPIMGPNMLRHLDHALGIVASLPVEQATRMAMLRVFSDYIIGHTLGEITQQRDQQRTGPTQEQWEHAVDPYMQRMMSTGEYPHLTALMMHEETMDAYNDFERGLALVLDGFAAQLDSASSQPARPSSSS